MGLRARAGPEPAPAPGPSGAERAYDRGVTWTVGADRWLRAHPVGPDVALALVLVAALGSYSLGMLQETSAAAWVRWLAVGAGGVLLSSVALRRIATEVAFGLASLAMAVIVALPNATVRPGDIGMSDERATMEFPLFFLPTSAVYLVVLYAVAAHRAPRRSLVALAVGVAGALLCTAKTATAYGALPAGWLTLLLALLALVAAVSGTWAVGTFWFQRRERRDEEIGEAADCAATEERQRIARDMHDIVAHSLAVIVRQAEGGASIAGTSPDRATGALVAIADTAREALADMRGTLAVLREGAPRDVVQPTLAEIPALVDRVRATGVDVQLTEQGSGDNMTPAAMLASFRLVQEALTNSVKHAGPQSAVIVTIAHTSQASVVTVSDDGGDAQSRTPVPGAGAGLRGVRDRVRAAGGRFEAGTAQGGFRVRAEFPRAVSDSGGARR